MNLLSDDVDDEMRLRWSMSMDRCFEVCDALEVRTILSCAAYEEGSVPHQQLVEGFASLCRRAGRSGIWFDLEPMPFLG